MAVIGTEALLPIPSLLTRTKNYLQFVLLFLDVPHFNLQDLVGKLQFGPLISAENIIFEAESGGNSRS